jgi:hypothetical protein
MMLPLLPFVATRSTLQRSQLIATHRTLIEVQIALITAQSTLIKTRNGTRNSLLGFRNSTKGIAAINRARIVRDSLARERKRRQNSCSTYAKCFN